jgi:hypothetical protein
MESVSAVKALAELLILWLMPYVFTAMLIRIESDESLDAAGP